MTPWARLKIATEWKPSTLPTTRSFAFIEMAVTTLASELCPPKLTIFLHSVSVGRINSRSGLTNHAPNPVMTFPKTAPIAMLFGPQSRWASPTLTKNPPKAEARFTLTRRS